MRLGLWGTINFVFGGKAKFGSIFSVWMFASLPGIIKVLLGTIVIFAGAAPESFNIKNYAPTNVGAFLNPMETNKALYALATSLDVDHDLDPRAAGDRHRHRRRSQAHFGLHCRLRMVDHLVLISVGIAPSWAEAVAIAEQTATARILNRDSRCLSYELAFGPARS